MGLEALSRGARLAIFVEKERKAVAAIRANIEALSFADRAEVYSLDVSSALKILQKNSAKFDIIFLGAPYGSPDLLKALTYLGEFNLLKQNGILIAEHRYKSNLEDRIGALIRIREERYGDTIFTFYKSRL